jgi:hypothetical protein
MAFTMAYPNFKKGLKMVFGPLGVNLDKNPTWPRSTNDVSTMKQGVLTRL